MARDEDALKLIAADDKWAGNANTTDLAEPGDDGIGVTSRNAGFQEIYSRAEGEKPERELFNQIFKELSGAIIELNQRGSSLEWDENITYIHPAIVFHNDTNGNPFYFRSKQNSKGEEPAGVSDYWEQIVITPATESDITGDPPRSAQKIVTPASLPDATTTTRGLAAGIATSGNVNAGNDTEKYITPRALAQSRYQRTMEGTVTEPTSGNTISSWNVGSAPVGNLTITKDRTLGAFSNPTNGGLYILRVRGGGSAGDTFTLTLNTNLYELGDRFQPENIPHNNTVLLGFMYINNRRYYIGELTGFNQ